MNKTIIIAAVAIAACGPSCSVWAAPFAWYNHANGGIWFTNDSGAPLANASVISLSGKLKTSSDWLGIAGARKDDSELPFAYTYLSLPVGQTFAGYVVQPGTHCSELTFEYRTGSLTGPLIQVTNLCIFPEPSSGLLAATTMCALSVVSRRLSRRDARLRRPSF
ncbi:MAG: hypothetical protein C0485_11400 [Pirellula sp.]|nr:hypothetical protein [Pirellula sp.]